MDFVRSWISFKRNPFHGCHAFLRINLLEKLSLLPLRMRIISQKLHINGWVIIIVTYNFF